MIKAKQRIHNCLRYPLMWVMLLWALTLPGHEVVVYNALFEVLSGKSPAVFTQVREEIAKVERHLQAISIYRDAAPSTPDADYLLQPEAIVPGSLRVALYFSADKVAAYTGAYFFAFHLRKFLFVSILPNAP